MLRSAGLYRNLFIDHDPGGAFMTTHPGATAMWIAGAGIMLQEQRLGVTQEPANLVQFRRAALWPIVLVVAGLIGAATWLLQRLFGVWPGVVAGVLLALEPYGVGMSQIVHLDALLALFMLNAALCFLLYRRAGGFVGLAAAGVFLGLAMATKFLPTAWVVLFFAAVLLWDYRTRVGEVVRRLGFTLGIAALVFYILWPALWFYADLEKYFRREVPYVIQDTHVVLEESEEPTSPASFYVRTILGRTTPFVLILGAGALIACAMTLLRSHFAKASRDLRSTVSPQASNVIWLIVYALGFLIFITIAAKKADRYALPGLVVLPVVAGWALAIAFTASGWVPTSLKLRGAGLSLIAILIAAQLFIWIPHSIAYNNPFFDVRPLSQQGWGEGLEEAAAWLNRQPSVEELFVASWYPGVMRAYFQGKTLGLSSRADERVGFVVLYRNMLGRGPANSATEVWEEFQNEKVAHVVEIQGVPYVWVYDTRGLHYFPNHVGELYGGATVGQLVPILTNGWHAIEVGMATFSSRHNTQDVIMHVREVVGPSTGSLQAGSGLVASQQDVRTVRVNASDVQDSFYHRFEFEPIVDSAGKTYYIFLESPTSAPGDAITVRFANSDLAAGEMVKNGTSLPGRDVAYRLPK